MNLLGHETSPYLRQHKDNPVHWMPWGEDAFARARAENKPVLLSVGYAACHWCHVMAHESFEDAGTADLMNSLFINIKVDREERPDVDALYQNAQALMGGQGGWPLTVFLTPEGKAFWGGTYFPPHPRHGLPSFREVLRGVADGFAREPDKIIHNVNSLNTALEKLHTGDTGRMVLPEQSAQIGEALLRFTDPVHGGFGGADGPKFPNLPALNLLWDSYIRTGSDKLKASVLQALTAMCQGGLYDHVGGGFARYTVDGEWLVPHFEKMLYDNAQFITLLTEVYRETQNPLFAAHIRSTIDWLLREMRVTVDGDDAFASSLDADSLDDAGHLEEGAFYVWRGQDIDFLLGDDAPYFREVFDITAFGNWHEKQGWNIPNRLAHPEWRGEEEEHKISALCRKLRFTRDQRAAPARDHKILADWNGMLVAGLAQAGFVLNMPAWTAQAESIFRFVTRQMMQPDGRLYHVWCDGHAAHTGFVEDYAQMSAAALALHDATGDTTYLDAALRWAHILCRDYADETGGGFFMTAVSAQDLPIRPKTGDDTAVPAGNAVLVGVFQRLYTLTGNAVWAETAVETAQGFSGIATRHIFPRATLIRHSLSIASPLSVVIVGTPAARADLLAVLRGISVPALVVQQTSGTETLPSSHPAFGKKSTMDVAAAFICTGRQCQAPVHNPTTFREMLLSARAGAHRPPANDG